MTKGGTMWTYEALTGVDGSLGPSVVALGTFDGVHIGHQRILNEAIDLGDKLAVPAVVFTFDRHPLATLAPDKAPGMITPLAQRIERLRAVGIDHVHVVRFDETIAKLSARQFLQNVLLSTFGARGIVVGYNFRFGHGAEGDTTLLQEHAKTSKYELRVIAPVEVDNEPVSSTRIRRHLHEGDVLAANRLLGYSFTIEGVVVAGDARGRTLGYPTANVEVSPDALWPQDGVYMTKVRLGTGTEAEALTVISDRPSFDTDRRTIESFLLNFHGELYDQAVEIRFFRKLRDIIKFSSPEQLVEQIRQDVQEAERFFSSGESAYKAQG